MASTIKRPVLTKQEIAKGLPPVAIQAAPVVNKDAQSTGYLIAERVNKVFFDMILRLIYLLINVYIRIIFCQFNLNNFFITEKKVSVLLKKSLHDGGDFFSVPKY